MPPEQVDGLAEGPGLEVCESVNVISSFFNLINEILARLAGNNKAFLVGGMSKWLWRHGGGSESGQAFAFSPGGERPAGLPPPTRAWLSDRRIDSADTEA
jgi:hypothetical protein